MINLTNGHSTTKTVCPAIFDLMRRGAISVLHPSGHYAGMPIYVNSREAVLFDFEMQYTWPMDKETR
jgi:hypothetical protein